MIDLKDFKDCEVFHIDMGCTVLCDMCNKDWSTSDATGGFLFQSKAVCPDCEKRVMDSIVKYGEQQYIRGKCPSDMSFADWVRGMRVRGMR